VAKKRLGRPARPVTQRVAAKTRTPTKKLVMDGEDFIAQLSAGIIAGLKASVQETNARLLGIETTLHEVGARLGQLEANEKGAESGD